MDAYMGMIMPFAGNYAPRQWAFCNGQLLSIAQFTALFSLLGTTYGGNGQTNFGLPNLNGRAIVGPGQLSGGGNYAMGQTGGAENVTLTTNQMPSHSHTVNAVGVRGTVGPAATNMLAGSGPAQTYSPYSTGSIEAMDSHMIAPVGGGQPVPTTTPYMCINYIICIEGLYPPRP